ncbi:hypothetical protein AJ78_05726 [Emergomyces pasteurianus Ep9510]|uniref:PH domain-containing protein n=1 Tax=Emergomyces pasteurianus Ep9510 TaxID=1447872 RepID=A0A1J9QCK7_9EURO|nr:hypothetical protein AJ78_05726 [Emergomyces pasteurianus Ep9510]
MDSTTLPQRSATVNTIVTTNTSKSDDELVLDSDMSETSGILYKRLQAWKHMCGYLETYISTTHKVQRSQSKELEKILKSLPDSLDEAAHFSDSKSGVTGLFANLRTNTTAIANLHLETEKTLKSTVLPILENLHQEIKAKAKELQNGAAKAAKQVEKARSVTQTHVEMLGQYTAAFESSTGGKLEPAHDPYILWRGTNHRLNKQVIEENNHLQEMLQVQNSFVTFESHILRTMQNAISQFSQCMNDQSDRQRQMYADMADAAQQIPPDFEWADFCARNKDSLLDPKTTPRSISDATFPNQEHPATEAVIKGILDRKSRAIIKGYNSGYYAVTPAGYLHGFKDNDDYRHEPTPDISLYLPDCTVGHSDGHKFTIKGKDVSGGKVGQAFATTTEFSFKADSKGDAERWLSVLNATSTPRSGSVSQKTSPSVSRTTSGAHGVPPLAHPATGATETSITSTSQQEEGTRVQPNDKVVASTAPVVDSVKS